MIDDRLTVSMQEVFRRIGVMNEKELSDTVLALMERYRILFPEEEIVFLSLPRTDPAERHRIIEYACRFSEEMSE